jgi:hypothetical protein
MVLQRGRTGNNDDEDDEAITNSWVQHVFAQDDASVAPEKPRQVALGTRIAVRHPALSLSLSEEVDSRKGGGGYVPWPGE